MDFLGVGPLEFIFILLIVLMVLGPKDIARTGRTLGRILRNIITSQWWHGLRQASQEIRRLPITLMREASIEDAQKTTNELNALAYDISQTNAPGAQTGFQSWISPVNTDRDHQISSRTVKNESPPEETQTHPPGG